MIAGERLQAAVGIFDNYMGSRCVTSMAGNLVNKMKDAGADAQLLKRALAVEISRMLDSEQLSLRQAQARTGIAAADFSRIRSSSDLERFTIDRLMAIINRLGSRVEVNVRLQPPEAAEAAAINTSPSL